MAEGSGSRPHLVRGLHLAHALAINGGTIIGTGIFTVREKLRMGLDFDGFAPLIQVFDMPRSVAFYRDVLGFEVAETSPPRDQDDFDWALLRRKGIEVMLNTAYEENSRPPQPDAFRVAAHGDTALFFGCRDLDTAYTYLSAKGVNVDPPAVTHYGMRQLHLRDPDGDGICLQWSAVQNLAGEARAAAGFRARTPSPSTI